MRFLKTGATLAIAAVAAVTLKRLFRLDFDLRGKVALVTGGSRGLGLEMARCLVAAGARVVICARHQQELDRAVDELRRLQAQVIGIVCDVTSREDVKRMVAEVEATWGGIDALINNAGIMTVGPLEHMTRADFEESLATHFWAPFHAVDLVLPGMRRRRSGRIVNIASIGGRIGIPHMAPYCAGKFALVGFSEAMRAELSKDGVLVTTVCPGMMRTGSPVNAHFKGRHRQENTWFTLMTSLPGLSVSSGRAAAQIIAAMKRGQAMVQPSLTVKVATRVHGLAPNLTSSCLEVMNHMLPKPGGIGAESRTGLQSSSRWVPSPLTYLTDRAALQNNEL